METAIATLAEAQRYYQAGDFLRAEEICRQRVQEGKPDADVLMLLASVYRSQKKLDDTVACLRQVLELNPQDWEVLHNLGVCLADQLQYTQAAEFLTRAIEVAPTRAESHIQLGHLHRQFGQLEQSIQCYEKALHIKESPEVRNLLGNNLCDQGRRSEGNSEYLEVIRQSPRYWVAHSNLLFLLGHDPNLDPVSLLAEHRRYGGLVGQESKPNLAFHNVPDPTRCLRIGYVSPDFREHVVMRFFEPVLTAHDPLQFETIAYSDVDRPDYVTNHIQRLFGGWRSTYGRSDQAIAEQIRRDAIDILVDLTGHTGNNRLVMFAQKPAPIQVTYLGYAGTTGLSAMDYRITDAVADPYGQPVHDTEELVRLPGCFFTYLPPPEAPDVVPPPAGADGPITFASAHKLGKLNEAVLGLWAQLLHAVPHSRLLITRNMLTEASAVRYQHEFQVRGVPKERLVMRRAARQTFLQTFESMDILLDVFPWNGHGMTCDALWMGVPVVTLCGNRFAGRMSASILTQLGLSEMIALTSEQYVAIAARLAHDREGLARYRLELRERMRRSVICDGGRYTRHLEDKYRWMWRCWCRETTAATAPLR